MSEEMQTRKCDACGQSVTYPGHRGFIDYHRTCPKRGTSAVDATHSPCPTHGTLVWVIGPYSAFRACENRNCTAGKRGKQWRYCAPRGQYAGTGNTTEITDARESGDGVSDVSVVEAIAVVANDTQSTEVATAPPTTTATTTESTSVQPTNAAAISLASLGTLGESIQSYVDARASQLTTEMITERLRDVKLGHASVEWKVNDRPFAKIEGAHHKALPRLLKLYAAGFRNFLVVGPAGSGKTTLAHNLATSLLLDFGGVSCTAGMSESALTGRPIPNLTTGATVFESTDFVRCYESGGVFLLDEVDAADANVMLVINSALANGHMPVPARSESPNATRHDNSVIICAANTWGTGADRQYVGRNQLDAAFLDRFVGATIEVEYDRDLESSLVADANICARVWTIRDKVTALKLRRVVGTRFLMSVARLVRGAGESLNDALRACTVGWTIDEQTKAGVR